MQEVNSNQRAAAAEGGEGDPLFSRALEQLTDHFADPEFDRSLNELLLWFDDMKARNHIMQRRVTMNSLREWSLDAEGAVVHREGRFFRIIGIAISSPSREVRAWSQPILDNSGTGVIGLLLRRHKGGLQALMQAKAEPGNRMIVQLAPTIQFTHENYAGSERLKRPFLHEEFMRPSRFTVVGESRQSEEGARFFREHHIHRILLLPDGGALDIPEEFRWMSFGHIRYFLHLGEYVNSCARSILACLI